MKFKLAGEIIPNDYAWIYDLFGEEHYCPEQLEKALREADPEDRDLIIEINSPGGYVFTGFETYSRLKELQREGWTVTAQVTALAASAATTIMSACGKVLCSPVAQVMIHLPMTATSGNRLDHKDSIEVLKSLEESIINGYVAKCGEKSTRDQLRKAMEKSTWMPAQQAIDMGLADGFIEEEEDQLFGVSVGAMASSVVNSAGNTYEEMLKRYESAVSSGLMNADPMHPVKDTSRGIETAPDQSKEDWEKKARLEIERARFTA